MKGPCNHRCVQKQTYPPVQSQIKLCELSKTAFEQDKSFDKKCDKIHFILAA